MGDEKDAKEDLSFIVESSFDKNNRFFIGWGKT
jgi:hypothetical protein